MKRLPTLYPSLREIGFYVGGFGWLIDMLVMPACMFALYAFPSQSTRIGRFLVFALKRWTPHGQWALLEMEATGQRDGRQVQMTVRVSHQDAYELTALAIVGTLMQYHALPKQAGLWTQAEYVVPETSFEFLKGGIHLSAVAPMSWISTHHPKDASSAKITISGIHRTELDTPLLKNPFGSGQYHLGLLSARVEVS